MNLATVTPQLRAVRKHGGGLPPTQQPTQQAAGHPLRSKGGEINSLYCAAVGIINLLLRAATRHAYPTTCVRRALFTAAPLRSQNRPHAQLVVGYQTPSARRQNCCASSRGGGMKPLVRTTTPNSMPLQDLDLQLPSICDQCGKHRARQSPPLLEAAPSNQPTQVGERMTAARNINAYPVDKVLEAKLAELVGTTQKALERKRERKVIPEGVWQKLDGRIIYSISRYNEWLESQWTCPPASNPSANDCASASHGRRSAGAKRLATPKPPRGSQRPQG